MKDTEATSRRSARSPTGLPAARTSPRAGPSANRSPEKSRSCTSIGEKTSENFESNARTITTRSLKTSFVDDSTAKRIDGLNLALSPRPRIKSPHEKSLSKSPIPSYLMTSSGGDCRRDGLKKQAMSCGALLFGTKSGSADCRSAVVKIQNPLSFYSSTGATDYGLRVRLPSKSPDGVSKHCSEPKQDSGVLKKIVSEFTDTSKLEKKKEPENSTRLLEKVSFRTTSPEKLLKLKKRSELIRSVSKSNVNSDKMKNERLDKKKLRDFEGKAVGSDNEERIIPKREQMGGKQRGRPRRQGNECRDLPDRCKSSKHDESTERENSLERDRSSSSESEKDQSLERRRFSARNIDRRHNYSEMSPTKQALNRESAMRNRAYDIDAKIGLSVIDGAGNANLVASRLLPKELNQRRDCSNNSSRKSKEISDCCKNSSVNMRMHCELRISPYQKGNVLNGGDNSETTMGQKNPASARNDGSVERNCIGKHPPVDTSKSSSDRDRACENTWSSNDETKVNCSEENAEKRDQQGLKKIKKSNQMDGGHQGDGCSDILVQEHGRSKRHDSDCVRRETEKNSTLVKRGSKRNTDSNRDCMDAAYWCGNDQSDQSFNDDEASNRSAQSVDRKRSGNIGEGGIGLGCEMNQPVKRGRKPKSLGCFATAASASKSRQENRPKRSSAGVPTSRPASVGLHWKEEADLQRALTASLHARRHSTGDTDHTSAPQSADGDGDSLRCYTPDSLDVVYDSASIAQSGDRKCQARAQRKFAQNIDNSLSTSPEGHSRCGAGPKADSWLPGPSHGLAGLPSTDDFITFLTFRGSHLLPPRLEYLQYADSTQSTADFFRSATAASLKTFFGVAGGFCGGEGGPRGSSPGTPLTEQSPGGGEVVGEAGGAQPSAWTEQLSRDLDDKPLPIKAPRKNETRTEVLNRKKSNDKTSAEKSQNFLTTSSSALSSGNPRRLSHSLSSPSSLNHPLTGSDDVCKSSSMAGASGGSRKSASMGMRSILIGVDSDSDGNQETNAIENSANRHLNRIGNEDVYIKKSKVIKRSFTDRQLNHLLSNVPESFDRNLAQHRKSLRDKTVNEKQPKRGRPLKLKRAFAEQLTTKVSDPLYLSELTKTKKKKKNHGDSLKSRLRESTKAVTTSVIKEQSMIALQRGLAVLHTYNALESGPTENDLQKEKGVDLCVATSSVSTPRKKGVNARLLRANGTSLPCSPSKKEFSPMRRRKDQPKRKHSRDDQRHVPKMLKKNAESELNPKSSNSNETVATRFKSLKRNESLPAVGISNSQKHGISPSEDEVVEISIDSDEDLIAASFSLASITTVESDGLKKVSNYRNGNGSDGNWNYKTPLSLRPQSEQTSVKNAAPNSNNSVITIEEGDIENCDVEIPTFHPSADQLTDLWSYIQGISREARHCGICRIVAPKGWQVECNVSQQLRFTPHTQYIHKLYKKWSPSVEKLACITKHLETERNGKKFEHSPVVGGVEIDLVALLEAIHSCGGLQQVINDDLWISVINKLKLPKNTQDKTSRLYDIYCNHLLSYDTLSPVERHRLEHQVAFDHERRGDIGEPCSVKSRAKSLGDFFGTARNVTSAFFPCSEPTTLQVEREYWRLVEDGGSHVAVQQGHAAVPQPVPGLRGCKPSGSSQTRNLAALLNNDECVLRRLGDIVGATRPVLPIGMLFTTACWSRDLHMLPYVQYLHTGADVIWYCIAGSEEAQLKAAMLESTPGSLEPKLPLWLPQDSVMVSPARLRSRGVRLGHVVQSQGQMIVVLPDSYTSSISTGYNIAERVSIADSNWLQFGCQAAELLRRSSKPQMFSMEMLLMKIVLNNESSRALLSEAVRLLEPIVEQELELRQRLAAMGLTKKRRLIDESRRSSADSTETKHRGDNDDNEILEECRCEYTQKICYFSMLENERTGKVCSLEEAVARLKKCKVFIGLRLVYRYQPAELTEMISSARERLSTPR